MSNKLIKDKSKTEKNKDNGFVLLWKWLWEDLNPESSIRYLPRWLFLAVVGVFIWVVINVISGNITFT